MEVIHTLIDFILHIDRHLVEIVSEYKTWTYLILFLIIFAETGFIVTPFLPGDSLLFAAGALIATGNTGLDIFMMGLLLTVAAVSGDTVNYFTGKALGLRVFKPGNKILKVEYYQQTSAFFIKHGGKAVMFSRFLPIIRTVAPFVAGVGKMPFHRFTMYNIAGGIFWIVSFLGLGFAFGNIPVVKQNFTLVVFAIIILSVLPPLYAGVRSRLKKPKAA